MIDDELRRSLERQISNAVRVANTYGTVGVRIVERVDSTPLIVVLEPLNLPTLSIGELYVSKPETEPTPKSKVPKFVQDHNTRERKKRWR
jgi:hypothetical protein